jgi:hypothetical protein
MRICHAITNGLAVQSDAPSKACPPRMVFQLILAAEGEKAAAAIVVAGEYEIRKCDVEGC